MYKLFKSSYGTIDIVIRLKDNANIPFDPANSDAVEFAQWLKNGNIPEPAVEGETVSQEWIQETINKLLP